ncbi:hypothetical protein ACET3Z_019642 [Daucus carota]
MWEPMIYPLPATGYWDVQLPLAWQRYGTVVPNEAMRKRRAKRGQRGQSKQSRKLDDGMQEWSCTKTRRLVSTAMERDAEKMKFATEMRLLEYREARQGKHWVPTKDETHIEVLHGVGRPLREYHYRKDRDINDAFLKGKITDEERIGLLRESSAEYAAKVKVIEKSNFDAYAKQL